MLSELWSDLRYRARALFRRAEVERELDAELQFHLEREAEDLQRHGLDREEARRRAHVAFGGTERIKEESRSLRGTVLLDTVFQDLRYGLRGLRAKPGFTAGVVLTLALGIGANTAMFGVVDRLLFRPPAYLRDAGRVQRVYSVKTVDRRSAIEDAVTVGQYLDLRRSTRSFTTIAGFNTWHLAVGEGERTREYPIAAVSASYFGLFDARPVLGRFFTAAEDRMPTGTPVAVLGYTYWRTAFGGRADVLGRTLRVGRSLYTIVGVAPRGFVGLDEDELPAMYLPLTSLAWNVRPEDHTRDYHWHWIELAVKRTPGVSLAAATADLTHALRLSSLGERPEDLSWAAQVATWRPHALLRPVQRARGPDAGPEARVVAWVSGVALVVLLIACANVANLLLARALTRRREVGLRLALGVTRLRLLRQLLTESLLLGGLGGVVGLLVAWWGGAVVRALFLPADVTAPVLTDPRTLAVTLLASVAAAIVTGLAPATQALRPSVAAALHGAGREVGARPARLRSALLVLQATLSVVLLVGAGLYVRSLLNVQRLHLGYDVDPVLTVSEQMRGVRLDSAGRVTLERRLVDAAGAVPGVLGATPATSVPFWGFEFRDLFVQGIDSVNVLGDFLLQAGNPDYFRVMGTRIVRGRGFDALDRAGSPRVTVVSQGMARALWPGRDPLGQCLRIDAPTSPCTTVVGVAEDLHMRRLGDEREYTYYVPIAQYTNATGMLLVRVARDAADYAEPVRRRLQQVMPGAAFVTTSPLRAMVDPAMRSWHTGATMFLAFGLLALALAAIGLYSVIAYGVAERRREIGVRIALGAPRASVLALVVRDGVRLALVGVALGSAIALAAGRWLAPLLFDESPRDPAVYGVVAALLLLVAWLATALPAFRAARLDPSAVLRAE